MKNIGIFYWTSTGNTEAMALSLSQSLQAAGNKADVFNVSSCDASTVGNYDAIALGASAMGAEELDPGEMEPFFESILPTLNGKNVLLFGSYGWGDGEWMRNWESRCLENGVNVVGTVIANGSPDQSAFDELNACSISL